MQHGRADKAPAARDQLAVYEVFPRGFLLARESGAQVRVGRGAFQRLPRGGKPPGKRRSTTTESAAQPHLVRVEGGQSQVVPDERTAMSLDVDLLEASFDRMAPRAEELVDIFYARLFAMAPGVLPLFATTVRAKQKAKLVAMLPLLRTSLRSLRALAPTLGEAGARYASSGVLPEHYPVVAAALLESMARVVGDGWSPKMAIAWAEALDVVANVMVEGATEALTELDRREPALRRFGASVADDILARQRRVAALATL